MRELLVVETVSLDGVMQAPGRADEDDRDDFRHGGWATELLSKDPEAAVEAMSGAPTATAMLFGRRTYTDLVGYWLSTPDPNPFTDVLRDTPKYVASRTMRDPLAYPNSTLMRHDVVDGVRRLKTEGEGSIVVLGSGDLVRQLSSAGLVDGYLLTIVPLALGSGTRLFDERTDLEPVTTKAFDSGVVVARYRVAEGR